MFRAYVCRRHRGKAAETQQCYVVGAMTLAELAKRKGVSRAALDARVKRGTLTTRRLLVEAEIVDVIEALRVLGGEQTPAGRQLMKDLKQVLS